MVDSAASGDGTRGASVDVLLSFLWPSGSKHQVLHCVGTDARLEACCGSIMLLVEVVYER